MSEWVRLKIFNDWDFLYYAPEGEGLTSWGCADHRRGWNLKRPSYTVRWKDGSVSQSPIRYTVQHVTTYDMGHEYPAEHHRAHVVSMVNGHEVLVPITDVELLRAEVRRRCGASGV